MASRMRSRPVTPAAASRASSGAAAKANRLGSRVPLSSRPCAHSVQWASPSWCGLSAHRSRMAAAWITQGRPLMGLALGSPSRRATSRWREQKTSMRMRWRLHPGEEQMASSLRRRQSWKVVREGVMGVSQWRGGEAERPQELPQTLVGISGVFIRSVLDEVGPGSAAPSLGPVGDPEPVKVGSGGDQGFPTLRTQPECVR
jgi:hypothetical protein